ncbi:hypothetical protein GGX14DRAFT_405954 [Mycena pura]|uniref:Uncharacterized protein n=1 Tax=Mycena pura TaxID=153505 RepID=A0AAD6Y209_9AGAR|nr:hypothetical protein GGX14DRAFT_405954 [Mycena pura]
MPAACAVDCLLPAPSTACCLRRRLPAAARCPLPAARCPLPAVHCPPVAVPAVRRTSLAPVLACIFCDSILSIYNSEEAMKVWLEELATAGTVPQSGTVTKANLARCKSQPCTLINILYINPDGSGNKWTESRIY